MLTPYGRDNAFLMLGIAVSFLFLAATPVPRAVGWLSIVIGSLLALFTMWFFRDPERPIALEAQIDPRIIVSPADGQVTEVTAIGHHADLGGPATQISIFLSPLNVHVNRYPATGRILHVRYFPGKYFMAFHPKASQENERSEVVIKTSSGLLLFRQITGFLARRIVYDAREGTQAQAGDRFGMMKFGSRMDVVVPASADVRVAVGAKVVSAATVLARMNSTEDA